MEWVDWGKVQGPADAKPGYSTGILGGRSSRRDGDYSGSRFRFGSLYDRLCPAGPGSAANVTAGRTWVNCPPSRGFRDPSMRENNLDRKSGAQHLSRPDRTPPN